MLIPLLHCLVELRSVFGEFFLFFIQNGVYLKGLGMVIVQRVKGDLMGRRKEMEKRESCALSHLRKK